MRPRSGPDGRRDAARDDGPGGLEQGLRLRERRGRRGRGPGRLHDAHRVTTGTSADRRGMSPPGPPVEVSRRLKRNRASSSYHWGKSVPHRLLWRLKWRPSRRSGWRFPKSMRPAVRARRAARRASRRTPRAARRRRKAAADRVQAAIAISHDVQRRDPLAELVHSPAPTPAWAVIRQDEREPRGLREPARRLVEPLDARSRPGVRARGNTTSIDSCPGAPNRSCASAGRSSRSRTASCLVSDPSTGPGHPGPEDAMLARFASIPGLVKSGRAYQLVVRLLIRYCRR